MPTPEWRNEILSRLDDLSSRAQQCIQYLVANNENRLEEKQHVVSAWERVVELFPEGFQPDRASDLARHLHFAMRHDFIDIETLDIPAIRESALRYGREGQEFIDQQIERASLEITISDVIHPQIRDRCQQYIRDRLYNEAVLSAIGLLMDEIRRLKNLEADGDSLVRNAVGVGIGDLAFSDCANDGSKSVTRGLTQVLQGLYKGVRNPVAHGLSPYNRLEAIQILVTCSLLLGRMQLLVDIE